MVLNWKTDKMMIIDENESDEIYFLDRYKDHKAIDGKKHTLPHALVRPISFVYVKETLRHKFCVDLFRG